MADGATTFYILPMKAIFLGRFRSCRLRLEISDLASHFVDLTA